MPAMLRALLMGLVATPGADSSRSDRLAQNAACMECHPEAAREWLASPHATSFVGGPFQSAITREPQAFCRGCHAPEQSAAIVTATPAAGIGVACVTCHVDADATSTTPSGHPSLRAAIDCGHCHQFDFPDSALRDVPLMMQSTVEEHARSSFAASSCTSCHMREGDDGRHDHGGRAATDTAMLESAVSVVATRTTEGVRLELRVLAAGHAVPTGDLFRRLEIGALAIDVAAPQRPARRFLGRRFAPGHEASGLRFVMEVEDDRIAADGSVRVVTLALPDAGDRPVVWWVEHQRVAFVANARELHGAQLDGRTPMAGGVLPHTEAPS